MSSTTSDPFMTASAPAIKFDNVGEVHTITVRQVEKKVDTNPGTGEIKTWPSGDPMHVFQFTGEDDGGEPISLWVRGNMVKAIREATQKAGLASVVNTKVTVKFTGLGEAKKGLNPAKLFAAKVEPVAPKATAFDEDEVF